MTKKVQNKKQYLKKTIDHWQILEFSQILDLRSSSDTPQRLKAELCQKVVATSCSHQKATTEICSLKVFVLNFEVGV